MGVLMQGLLRAFSLKTIQECPVLYRHLKKHGKSIEDLDAFLKTEEGVYWAQGARKVTQKETWWPPPRKHKDKKKWLSGLSLERKEFYKAWRKLTLHESFYGYRRT